MTNNTTRSIRLYDGGLLILLLIIGIVAAAGLGGGLLGKKLDTVKTYTAALTVYDGLITGADVYVTECAEKIIDQSCVPLARQVFAAAEQSKAAYVAAKQYGANPPQTVAEALVASVNVLQSYFAKP